MVPSTRPWALIGLSASHLIKLAHLPMVGSSLLPTEQFGSQDKKTPTGMWYPDTNAFITPSPEFQFGDQ
ncbi:hypothetical protein DSO57_1033691, partial [Entomophthora muscae]